jgi:hypothetical protein
MNLCRHGTRQTLRRITPLLVLGEAGFGCSAPTGVNSGWSRVQEVTSCEALNPSYCVGGSGFSITSDGRYTVGAEGSATAIVGNISDAERAELSAAASLVAANLSSSAQCDSGGTVPGSGDAVDLVDTRQASTRIYDLGINRTCYNGGREQAIRLHTIMRTLLLKYYPIPFPSQ